MADKKYITPEQLQSFAEQADKRLDDLEANRAKGAAFTLSSDNWTEDSGDTNYPYQYKLTVEGVTTASRADAVLDAGSVVVAMTGGLCPLTETAENTVIFKSCEAPTGDLTGILYIKKSAAMSGST